MNDEKKKLDSGLDPAWKFGLITGTFSMHTFAIRNS